MVARMLSCIKKGVEAMKSNQSEINNISEIKNILEGISSRLDEARDRISKLKDQVEKKHSIREAKRKKN